MTCEAQQYGARRWSIMYRYAAGAFLLVALLPSFLLGGCSSTPAGTPGTQWGAPWPMFGCDLRRSGLSPFAGPTTGVLRWRFRTQGSIGSSSPVIDRNGVIYIATGDGTVYAINADGTQKWAFPTGGGVDTTPAIGEDGTIYVASVEQKLYAIKPDGTQKWVFDLGVPLYGAYGHSSPAVIQDGTIYVGSMRNGLYAINPDGTEKWVFARHVYETPAPASVAASPAVSPDGTIFVPIASHEDWALCALDPNDGSQRWAYPLSQYPVVTTPAIGLDWTIYVGTDDQGLLAIYRDGTLRWRSRWCTGEVLSSPAVDAMDRVYVSCDDGLYAIDANDFIWWEFSEGGPIWSSPAVDVAATVFVASAAGKVYGINATSFGVWEFETGAEVTSSPAIGRDFTIYVGSTDGYVYAVR
ncbi:MAG: PQQ-binding-like beta-propeller repeat protein [Armatimonadota bacterium]